MKKFNASIFLGLNDAETKIQLVSTESAMLTVSDMVINNFGGGSLFVGVGVYRHKDGTKIREKSIKIDLCDVTEAEAREFCKVLRNEFKQESVMLTLAQVSTCFIED